MDNIKTIVTSVKESGLKIPNTSLQGFNDNAGTLFTA